MFTRYGEGMSLKSDVARIQSDATRSESERIWAAIALIAARFDSKEADDDTDDILGLLFDDE